MFILVDIHENTKQKFRLNYTDKKFIYLFIKKFQFVGSYLVSKMPPKKTINHKMSPSKKDKKNVEAPKKN